MRPRRARRGRSTRTYSLAHLLIHQPKSIAKHPDYALMVAHFNTSAILRRLRISRRCYSLLDRATIAPENLADFYQTYRLPRDPFFPLFFAVKHAYLTDRARIRDERRRYIAHAVRALHPTLKEGITYLRRLERNYSAARQCPIWEKHLYPATKKRVDQYSRSTSAQRHALFREHLELLSDRYHRFPAAVAKRVAACLALGLVPTAVPPVRPTREEVNRAYRRLSLVYHPDRGGDPSMFREIKRARDLLNGKP